MPFSNRKPLITFACVAACLLLDAKVSCLALRKDLNQQARFERTAQKRKSVTGTKEKADRSLALATLVEAADRLKSSDDLYESIRLYAEIADVLWPHDSQSARTVLLRGWETSNAPDAETRMQGLGASEDPIEDSRKTLIVAKRHLISAAMKHDLTLATNLRRAFEEDLEREADRDQNSDAERPKASRTRGARELSNVGLQRLLIAEELLDSKDYQSAARVASLVVPEGATPPLLSFIRRLRLGDEATGNALYQLLIDRLRVDATANANDVLLICAPFVSPELNVSIGADGALSYSPVSFDPTRRTPLPQTLRLAFFDTAAAVLLRHSAIKNSPDADTMATYFVTLRLLPHFQREVPRHVPALSIFLNTLASSIPPERREMLSKGASLSTLSPKNSADPLGSLLDAINRAANSRERDSWRFRAVSSAAARKLWDRAKRLADEIEDSEARRNAHSVIAIHQVMTTYDAFVDDDGEEYERAAVSVQSADVPPEARAIGFTQAAELASKRSNAARAAELLAEATSYAQQADVKHGTRAMALAFIILAGARTGDVARSWELLPALVNSANDAEELPFDAFTFDFNFTHLGNTVSFTAPGKSISLGDVFAQMAKLDLKKSLVEARGLKDELMGAQIMVAMSRAYLEFKGPRRASR